MVGEALAAQSRSKRAAADRGRQEKQTQDEGKRQRESQEEPASEEVHAGRGRLQEPRRRGDLDLSPGTGGLRLRARCTHRARAHRKARRHRSDSRRVHPLGPGRLPRPRQTRTTRPFDRATLSEVRRGRRQIGRSGKNVTTRMRGRDGSSRGLCCRRDWGRRGLGCRRDDARRCRGSQASGSARHLGVGLRDRCVRLVRCAGRRSGSLILRLVGLILPDFVGAVGRVRRIVARRVVGRRIGRALQARGVVRGQVQMPVRLRIEGAVPRDVPRPIR
jgi:hypothetical protein